MTTNGDFVEKSALSRLLKNKNVAIVMDYMRTIANTNYFVFAISGLLGAVFFVYMYGTAVLDSTYIDWIAREGDNAQHYFGWAFFRNSDWYFPLGLSRESTYPFRESIMFTDSIPAFAIFFKAISFLLPPVFQYFGWFGILMYILQGGIGGLIVKRITESSFAGIIGSLFFIMSAVMTHRMFMHTALGAHFIILLAFYICMTKDKDRSMLKNILVWGGLLSLAVGIHPYFIVMVFPQMVFYFVDDVFEHRNFKKSILEFCASLGMLAVAMYIIGFFYSDAPIVDVGLGFVSANLNSIVNPNYMSRFLMSLPLYTAGQLEGTGYIGYGMIIFFFIAVIAFANDFKANMLKLKDKRLVRRIIFSVIVFVAFYLVALSPIISLNDNMLFNYIYYLPGFVETIWSIFRASGRFMWPVVYMVMIAVIWVTARKFKKHAVIAILIILVAVQYQDLSNYFEDKGSNFREVQVWESDLKSDMWHTIASDYRHLFFVDPVDFVDPVNATEVNQIKRFTSNNRLTQNDAHFARKDANLIYNLQIETRKMLYEGLAQDNYVYIFQTPPTRLIFSELLHVYVFDGIIAGFANEIASAVQMEDVVSLNKNSVINLMPPVSNITEATDTEDGRILHHAGATWSNLYSLPPGTYIVEWVGYNFDHGVFDSIYWNEELTLYHGIVMTELENTIMNFTFSVYIPENTFIDRFQVRLFNNSEVDILVESVKLWRN